ncbi:hypothetical protein Tco_0336327 [Tanacetum coccineum]
MATHNRIYIAPSHTKKNFANMRRQGKDFSGRVTPLFPTMVVQAQEEIGEGSAMPTDPHHTPIITQPQWKQKSRRPKEKDTKIPQSSVPMLDLENTKTAQAQEITSLKKRVKKLEKKRGSRTYKLKRLYMVGRSRRVVSSKEEILGDQEDASKQRRIDDIDADEDITLKNVHRDEDIAKVQEKGDVIKEPSVLVSAASTKISTVIPTTDATTITTVSSRPRVKDKGKGKMVEEEPVKKMSKKEILKLDEELDFKLQAKEDEEESSKTASSIARRVV